MPQTGRVQVYADRRLLPTTLGFVADTANLFELVTVGPARDYKYQPWCNP